MTNQTKKAFCLRGAANTGKSHTFRNLFNEIVEKYHLNKDQDCDIKENGKIDILVIIHNVNGLKIGICSYGDNQADIQSRVSILVKENCDIIFCACRTYGESLDETLKLCEIGYILKFISKQTSNNESEHDNINLNQAKALLAAAGL